MAGNMAQPEHDDAEGEPGHRKADVYYIRRADQIEALISTRRQPIGDLLAVRGPMSVKEMAKALGQKPSALYHHLNKLVDVGLVREVGSRITNRRVEKLYDTPAVAMRFGFSVEDGELREVWEKLQLAHSRQSDRDFIRGFDVPTKEGEGPTRNMRTFRLVGAPDDKAMAKINELLDQVAEILWESAGQDNPLVALTCVLAALPSEQDR